MACLPIHYLFLTQYDLYVKEFQKTNGFNLILL